MKPWYAVVPIVLLAACDCSGGKTSRPVCRSSADCEPPLVCVDGTCRMPGVRDAGGDTGNPVGPDCVDGDGDGHFRASERCVEGTDCDDRASSVHPGAPEVCGNTLDDDCDGAADEPECVCRRGERVVCYSGPAATAGVGLCRRGIAVCQEVGRAGECLGERTPTDEVCNGEDDDCDGTVDEGVRNACGVCGAPEPEEMCGNERDDDCDGRTDEDCNCDYRCLCMPGEPCTCEPPRAQPCYEGPYGTGGVGRCRGGLRDCLPSGEGGPRWGECVGQVLPGVECEGGRANGEDDDCDGLVDEGCRDMDGDGASWPDDCDDGSAAVRPGAREVCNGRDDDCNGSVDEGVTNGCGGCGAPAAAETCDNGLDDDCNGEVDDGCGCPSGSEGTCYTGPPGTAGVGRCRAGTYRCEGLEFGRWTECTGAVGPLPEVCNGEDDDCDGEVDERWAVGSNPCGWCSGTEVCDGEDNDCDGRVDEGVANRCGRCEPEPVETCNGRDDDCDGMVDDGVVNACGRCPPEPCFEEPWERPADCMADPYRRCDGVVEHPDHPGDITLGQGTFESPFIYIAVTGRNEVAQIDTDTGVKRWQRPSHGTWPSRTAVAFDGSVWVGNRGFGNPADVAQSNVVHLDLDGNLVCRADVPGIARGVAIDADGNVWAGTWNGQTLYKISGTEVDRTVSPPRCRILGSWHLGVNIYGLAVDGAGYVWTASSPNTVRASVRDPVGDRRLIPNPWFYGIAPAATGWMWHGGWGHSGPVHAFRPDFTRLDTAVTGVTAVTVHPEGSIWGSMYGAHHVVGIEPDGRERCRAPIPAGSGSNPHGVAVDRRGRIWVPSRYGGYVNVFDTACRHVATYPVDVGQENYSYSDMTGHLLRTVTSREGFWMQDFDAGYERPVWSRVEWTATAPPETGVEVTVFAAPTRAALTGAMPCGPFRTSPADLSVCPFLAGNRYLRVQFRLTTSRDGVRPIVHDVRAFWAY
ncbi:MAG: MopE-related protein [Myxococcota bacterium]|nr:MopE-related protein [Myxococcota bacterium]MDW8362434.1 MopE-related protein [Myxococcales bacterium]